MVKNGVFFGGALKRLIFDGESTFPCLVCLLLPFVEWTFGLCVCDQLATLAS